MEQPLCKLKDRLKIGLEVREMKAIELSEKTGIPKSAISQYLSGYAKPKQDRIYLICKALHVDPGWLMGFDVPMESTTNGILSLYEIASISNRLRTDVDAQTLFHIYYEELTPENQKRLVEMAKGLSGR